MTSSSLKPPPEEAAYPFLSVLFPLLWNTALDTGALRFPLCSCDIIPNASQCVAFSGGSWSKKHVCQHLRLAVNGCRRAPQRLSGAVAAPHVCMEADTWRPAGSARCDGEEKFRGPSLQSLL